MHRDLKLANILSKSGQVKVGDFSLSCFITPGISLQQIVGTVMYMAPEVANGLYDHRADIWSVGVCCYALLSGTMPFANRGRLMMDCCTCV